MTRAFLVFIVSVLLSIPALTVSAQVIMEEDSNHTHDFTFPKSDVYSLKEWKKIACHDGREYSLFNELDSGFVIIHEYIMVNCRPCITAGKGLVNVIAGLKRQYPGKIKFYQTVYEDETHCDTMMSWVQQHGFTPDAVFIKGADEVDYYGGMGMPTIVVLGGGQRHKGYYKKQGYQPRDNAYIIKAAKRAVGLSKNRFETGSK